MQDILMILLLFIWFSGTVLRIYKQARFYQIEEYTSTRYIRWLFNERNRWLPTRAMGAVLISIVLGFFTDSIPGQVSIFAFFVAIVGASVASVPTNEKEIKKAFVRTQRATRLLGASFVIAGIISVILIALLNSAIDGQGRGVVLSYQLAGFALWLFAPIWLVLGNIAMIPVEGFMRGRFVRQAKSVMADVNPKVIGVTGSYGKTTTKNYIRDLLGVRYNTYATPKSYNTMMGLCIAINRDVSDDYSIEYFVAEMGMYGMGEIRKLTEFTPPDISLVIEVGPQHLERAGSIENIAKAKYEIIEGLSPDGVGIFNWDNDYVRDMYERGYPDTRIAVSRTVDPQNLPNNPPRFIASDITETLNGLTFDVTDTSNQQTERFETPLVGVHNVTNLLMATAVAVHEGVPLKDLAWRVRSLKPAESRLESKVGENEVTIINDAYSANPVGAISALRVLGMYTQRKVLITPGMVELGDLQYSENKKLGVEATKYATEIILVGEKQTQPIADGIAETDFDNTHLHIFDTLGEAINWYKSNLETGDVVLFLNDLPDTY